MAYNSIAYRRGVTEFDCGSCPECLRKRSGIWALRSFFEAKEHAHNCMITLTYDNYLRDEKGCIIGETIPDRDLHVCKRDVQLFVKRLRKYFYPQKIKYLITAEYGKKTHRAHYHALLFGVDFPDAVRYKRSKRNNWIYVSKTLARLWNHGICTIDNLRLNSATARYCTKYCAKQRNNDDTFMLMSRGIGLHGLLQSFNGLGYFVEGVEYPVPRLVWNEIIQKRYDPAQSHFSYRYRHIPYDENMSLAELFCMYRLNSANAQSRARFRSVRDNDPQYQRYLKYWSERQSQRVQVPVRQRILSLPSDKYFSYKQKALRVYDLRAHDIYSFAPGSSRGACFFSRHITARNAELGIKFHDAERLPFPSCLLTANDTNVELPNNLQRIERAEDRLFSRVFGSPSSPMQIGLRLSRLLPSNS